MSLSQKYRPKFFKDVSGQDLTILENDIKSGNYKHYIFAGQYGSGKTSVARIFAKSVNCKNRVGVEPCNECQVCRAVDNESSMMVKEYDAAMFGRMETMRMIEKELRYSFKGGKKVYILDEVQNMSKEAYDSLLKMLEKYVGKVIFILITTELWKIPDTIKSRCVLINFRKLSVGDIMNRLRYVADLEGVEIDDGSLELIASFSDGSMRDGLKYLEIVKDMGKVSVDLLTKQFGIVSLSDIKVIEEFIKTGVGVKQVMDVLNKDINYKFVFRKVIQDLFLISMSDSMIAIYNDLIDFYKNLDVYKFIEKEVFINLVQRHRKVEVQDEQNIIEFKKLELNNERQRDFFKLFKMVQ